ncbi:MAG TPA: hypothetical protein VHW43_14095 [Puia sp.]|nr:hypothetical protein [Puia sp.]
MQRRSFLFYTVMGAITMTTGCGRRTDPRAVALETPDFLSHVCDAATMRQLGAAYRTQTPAEASEETLIGLLKPGITAQTIKTDYANGDIVTIKGWVLSRTEARQCALFSLDSK